MSLLKTGRHFRLESGDKVIVARDQEEGDRLIELHQQDDYLLVPENFSGPVVVLQGKDIQTAVKKLLFYTKKFPSDKLSIECTCQGKSFYISPDDIIA